MKTSLKCENNKIFMRERERKKKVKFSHAKVCKTKFLANFFVRDSIEVNETSNTVFAIYQSKRYIE